MTEGPMISTALQKSFDQRFSLVRTLDKSRMVPEAEQRIMTLMEAEQGCFFTCFGDTYYVKEKNQYQEMSEDFSTRQDYFVTELTCLCLETGATGHFEWEYDDKLEIAITLDQTKFSRLTDDEGQSVDEDDLDQIVRDKDAIVYAGEKFWYQDDWAAMYQHNGKEEPVYMYEFENDTGTMAITIEEWTGTGREEYKIYISKSIIPEEITLLSKGAARDDIL